MKVKIRNLFVVNLLRDIVYLPLWYIQKYIKRDSHLWIFGAWFGNSYSDNSKIVFEEVLANYKDIKAVWITRNSNVYKDLVNRGINVAMCGSLKGIYYCIKAKYVFVCGGLTDFNEHCLNGAIQVWLWHGMPMKHICYDQKKFDRENGNFNFKEKVRYFFPYRKNIKPKYFLSTSSFHVPILKSAFHITEENIYEIGLPRNDCFFNNYTEQIIKNIRERYSNPFVILYMPTFRDDIIIKRKEAYDSFKNSFMVERFCKILNEQNIVFLYKGHFYDLQLNTFDENISDRFIKIDDSMYDNLYSVIKDVDLLMTDYSSIYFDFLLLRKPVILTPFDYDTYITQSRPLYFDYYSTIDGVVAKNWNDVMDILEKKSYFVPGISTLEKFHKYIDNKSTERVIETVLNDFK